MAERTTQLRPLGKKDIEIISLSLINYAKIERDNKQYYFSPLGIFNLIQRPLRYEARISNPMWAPLSEYDPGQTMLSTFKGQLIVRNRQGLVLKSIPPSAIRRIGIEPEMGIVQESGYVLANHLYILEDDRRIKMKEFDRILQLADRGHRPPACDEDTRVKVDPALSGKNLWIGIFEFELERDPMDRDAVVIDPETRQMIEREVTRPLSRERWG